MGPFAEDGNEKYYIVEDTAGMWYLMKTGEKYQRVKNIFLIGCGLSLTIEIVQLFTLYGATDIDDLITNVAGTLIGYFCFRLIHKRVITKARSIREFEEPMICDMYL